MKKQKQKQKGISLLEIIIVISIIAIISAIAIMNLSSFRNERTLRNTTEDIISLLNEARNNTISSLNSTNYGIHFETDKFILFIGSTYVENEGTNKQTDLDPSIEIPTSGGINLNGGGDDIIFERITGNTSNYGTIKVQLTSDVTRFQIVTINKLGIVSKN